MESIHGHDVLEMMMSSNKGYNRDELLADINNKFGEKARFHTCSADDLSAEALIDFLAERGKFMDKDAGFTADRSKMCGHDDH